MKQFSIEFKWAFIFVLMTLLWILLEKLTGLHSVHIDQHAFYTNFIAIPAITIYAFALTDKRNNYYAGEMNYQQGFLAGFFITSIVTILSPLTQILVFNFITPEYFPNAIKYSVEVGYFKQKEAEEYFNLNNYLMQAFIGTPIMGLITTAVVAIFTRGSKKNV